MGPAYYGTAFKNSVENYSAISFWANDATAKYDDVIFNHIEKASAKMIISLFVSDGSEYVYVIDALNHYWTNYTISFADFKLDGVVTSDTVVLNSANIIGIKFGLQYFYYLENGSIHPMYINNNYVYFDTLKFTKDTTTSQKELSSKLTPSKEDANICYIDNFDSYTNESLASSWGFNETLSYSKMEVSSDTSTNSGKSLKLQYQGNENSVTYSHQVLFDETVKGKAIALSLKGDNKATVYINIYMTYANTTYKYRATLTNVSDSWNKYTVGFNNFTKVEGTGSVALSSTNVKYITKITFGIVNSKDHELSNIYVDDIMLDANVGYTANTKSAIGG